MTEPNDAEKILCAEETAEWLKARGMTISAQGVRRAIKAGTFPGRVMGNRYVTSIAMLRDWLGLAIAPAPADSAPDGTIRFLGNRERKAS